MSTFTYTIEFSSNVSITATMYDGATMFDGLPSILDDGSGTGVLLLESSSEIIYIDDFASKPFFYVTINSSQKYYVTVHETIRYYAFPDIADWSFSILVAAICLFFMACVLSYTVQEIDGGMPRKKEE